LTGVTSLVHRKRNYLHHQHWRQGRDRSRQITSKCSLYW